MSQPAQGALHAVRPLLLLVILAQGQQQNPFLAPQALFQRCITVTPLRYDLSKKSVMQRWRDRLDGTVSVERA